MTVRRDILLMCLRADWIVKVIWGVICALFSLVNSSSGLAAARFFLGFAEAGFLPGIVFWSTFCSYRHIVLSLTKSIVGSWYPRPMQGRRFGVLYSSVSVSISVSDVVSLFTDSRFIAHWRIWYVSLYGTISASNVVALSGGLLATAIHTLDGAHGIAGWR